MQCVNFTFVMIMTMLLIHNLLTNKSNINGNNLNNLLAGENLVPKQASKRKEASEFCFHRFTYNAERCVPRIIKTAKRSVQRITKKNVNKLPGEETGRVDPQGEQVGGGGHPGPPRPHGRHARYNKKSEKFHQKTCFFPSGFTLAPMGQLGHPMMHHPMSHI